MLVEEKVKNHKKDSAAKEKLDNISPCHTVYEDRLSLIQGNSRRFSHICTRNLILIYDFALKFFLTFFFFLKCAVQVEKFLHRTVRLSFMGGSSEYEKEVTKYSTETEFLDKSLKSFPLCYSQPPPT